MKIKLNGLYDEPTLYVSNNGVYLMEHVPTGMIINLNEFIKPITMNREELIKKTYIDIIGEEDYKSIESYISKKNGFLRGNINGRDHSRIYNRLFDFCHRFNDDIRPNSLMGLEDNNGWTKIESKEDLPDHGGDINIVVNGHIKTNCNFIPSRGVFFKYGDVDNVTHWKNVKKEEMPLF